MPQMWTKTGLICELNTMLNQVMYLHLYANDYYPSDATQLSDLVECSWLGYVPLMYTGAYWEEPCIIGDKAITHGVMAMFLNNEPTKQVKAFGYYWTNESGTKLIGAQRGEEGTMVASPYNRQIFIFPTWTHYGQY